MTTTKAQLEQQLADALARIAELEAQEPVSRAHLSQAVWLPRGDVDSLLENRWLRHGITRKSDTWVTLNGAQYAARNQDGSRSYGAGKSLIAYGQPADDLLEVLRSGGRLVAIEAYEVPSTPREGDNRRFSEWKVVEVRQIGTAPAPAPAQPVAAGYGEPSEEEVPF